MMLGLLEQFFILLSLISSLSILIPLLLLEIISVVGLLLFLLIMVLGLHDRLCGLVVRVLGYRFGGPGSIPGTTRFSDKKKKRKQVVGLERGSLSLVEYN
jgi:hypothetical protein